MIEPDQTGGTLVPEILRCRESADLAVWWLGQSGFVCASSGKVVVFDPYLSDSLTRKYAGTDKPHVRMSSRVMSPEELRLAGPTVVTSTHHHTDHLDADTLGSVLRAPTLTRLIAPKAWLKLASERAGVAEAEITGCDAGEMHVVGGIPFTAVPAAHPELARDHTGHHQFLGYMARIGRFVIYHSGDTVVYPGMVDELRRHGPIDLALLPINGKVGNMNGTDAARLAKAIGARLVVPCHYHMFEFNTAEPGELFEPECQRLGQAYRVLRLGERLTIKEATR